MISDLRFAFRLLAKTPGFTALAVLSLAAAIGVNSGIFSIVDAAFLRPFIARHPEEVVNVFTSRKEAEQDFRQFSYAEFKSLAEPNEIFADLGAMEFTTAGVGSGDSIRRSITFLVSEGYFRIHGVQPAQGRVFTADESSAGAAIPVAVLSDSLWRRLGHKADIVGSALRINGQIFTVVGVMPRTFSGGNALIGPELWLPLGARDLITSSINTANDGLPLDHPRSFELNLIARLKPGLTPEAATARLPALAARLDAVKADASAGPRTLVVQAPSRINLSTEPSKEDNLKTLAALLLGLAGVVLLIACLNLANLMLARGAARAREFAIRTAIGATRGAIIRQLLIEGLLLSLAGGAFGLLLATWANELLVNSVTQLLSTLHFNITLPLAPDLRTVLVTFGFCTVATLLFALAPAWRVSRTDVSNNLKNQGQPDNNHRGLSHFFAPRQLLFMAQLALALMLLFCAGLFFRGTVAAASVSPGFDPRGGLVVEYDYTLLNLPAATMRQRANESLVRASALPGIEQVAIGTLLPYGIQSDGRSINAIGGTLNKEGKPEVLAGLFNAVSAAYFVTIGVPVLRGREFTEAEASNPDARAVIIDEQMAKKLFPDRDALGRHVQFSTPEKDGSRPEFEIVGIVGAHRHDILSAQAPKRIFVPLAYGSQGAGYLHVKLARADEAALSAMAPTLRAELRRGDPAFPLLALRTFPDIVETNIGRWIVQLGATLFGVFGGIALILAIAGVYGVKAYAVERRQREIGIRMAIGARQSDVLRLFLSQGLRQIGASLGLGLLLSFVAGRALSAMLYRVSPFDPLVLACAGSVLAAAAVLATWIPARRATRVDPCIVLRSE
jgi:predicted permease